MLSPDQHITQSGSGTVNVILKSTANMKAIVVIVY